jgi:hypothetical protein
LKVNEKFHIGCHTKMKFLTILFALLLTASAVSVGRRSNLRVKEGKIGEDGHTEEEWGDDHTRTEEDLGLWGLPASQGPEPGQTA